jgi:signal transduction histidine kinase/CheY-like chemotaxis protein
MVLGAAGIGFCRVDRALRLSGVDSQFKALFGWPPDAAPTWSDLEARIADCDRAVLAASIQTAFDEGTAIGRAALDRVVSTLESDEGSRWISLLACAVADEAGARPSLLLVARDATEQQRKVESLHAAVAVERRTRDAAEAANRAKDEFLSVVSHELRSPLNAILGWNRILAIKRSDDAEVQAVAPRIEQSARAQLKIVNDLLDLGRIGTGKLHITPRQLKLGALVAAAIDAARPTAHAKGLELVAECSSLPPPISGDPERLSQVIANLLSNAMKFTPRQGRITVSLREHNGEALISVADTGRGIDADLLPHIFDRFRQGDSSTTRNTGGLGLGLTLVREIVALHGGTVAASSEGTDRGSTFVVTLPAARASDASPGEVNGRLRNDLRPPPQLEGLSILVVDDEADARAVVAETLRLEGAAVTVGDSARAALAHLRTPDARFDVLVTDIGMPEEDGYSLVRKLRSLSSRERMVAIALTGYASRGDIDAAIDAGFDLHVPKPVDFDSFVPIIRRLATSR